MIIESWHPHIVLGLLGLLIFILSRTKWDTAICFSVVTAALLAFGIVSTQDFLLNLANPSILSIFLLIFITAAINHHFDIAGFFDRIFSRAKSQRSFTFRMGIFVSGVSAFMNNTPVVAIMIPYVHKWTKKQQIAPSKLMLPLSYFAICGGVITLIGTSTNLVLNGLLQQANLPQLSFFAFAAAGVTVTIGGIIFLVIFGNKLLPARKQAQELLGLNPREYFLETRIASNSPLVGKDIMEAGLRNLQGVFLAEVMRGDKAHKPVRPDFVLQENDLLYFVGDTTQVVDILEENNGLEISKKEKFTSIEDLEIIEAVIPANSTLSGHTVKELHFREKYDAAIVGIHRNGEKVAGKIGEIALEVGDLLLLIAGGDFQHHIQKDKNLYIVSFLKKIQNKKWSKAKKWYALTSLLSIGLGILFSVKLVSILLLLLFLQVLFRLTDSSLVKKSFDLKLLIILVSALTLGHALLKTHALAGISDYILSFGQQSSPLMVMVLLFAITFLLTSFVTNVAAISIAFPLAVGFAEFFTAVDSSVFFLTAAFGASAAFITPYGYQTNLMIYGPGNYTDRDFLRIGLPFTLLFALLSLTVLSLQYNVL